VSNLPHTTWTSPLDTTHPADELADCVPTAWDSQSSGVRRRGEFAILSMSSSSGGGGKSAQASWTTSRTVFATDPTRSS
jgi:hypothetical protein